MLFSFRLAFTLRRSLAEIQAMPVWERAAWRSLFDVVGPLDWTRADWLDARALCAQTTGRSEPEDLLMFRLPEPTPTDRENEQLKDKILVDF